jgi:ribosome-binding protein aMBF1 (putative translation factor)
MTPEQSTAARELLCWSREDLALLSGVSDKVIDRFEGRRRVPWGRMSPPSEKRSRPPELNSVA